MFRFAVLLLALAFSVNSASAQLARSVPADGVGPGKTDTGSEKATARLVTKESTAEEAEPELYYVVQREAIAYRNADSTRPYLQLAYREPVHLVGRDGHWSQIRTQGGARGFVLSEHISNTWIRISKSEKTLYVYRGAELAEAFPIDLGFNTFADKERRGTAREKDHWRTPEGRFFVVGKNARSQFYKAFVLNYPNAEDARKGLDKGLITGAQYEAIVEAEKEFRMPPMNTPLGGMIEIHGNGTGKRTNWTQGCVAITDAQMDHLWDLVEVGTPVLIEP